jgi:hypothetical protein
VEWVGGRPKRVTQSLAWSNSEFVPSETLRAANAARAATEARRAPQQRTEAWIDTSDGDAGSAALRRGMRVSHPKFGVGKVQSVMPGAPAKAVVSFESIGEKTVVATYLEPLY